MRLRFDRGLLAIIASKGFYFEGYKQICPNCMSFIAQKCYTENVQTDDEATFLLHLPSAYPRYAGVMRQNASKMRDRISW